MQAEYYKNSIAIFGNTKPWKETIKSLGGLYNKNLGGRPGWILNKSDEEDVMQFIANANAGLISPQAVVIPQPAIHQPGPMMPQPGLMIPHPTIMIPKLINPTGTVIMPYQPRVEGKVEHGQIDTGPPVQKGKFISSFVATDGILYQILIYTIPIIMEGATVKVELLEKGGEEAEYIVKDGKYKSEIADNILLTNVDDVGTTIFPLVVQASVVGGEWQIMGLNEKHKIKFSKY